jgi:hypothetical protein
MEDFDSVIKGLKPLFEKHGFNIVDRSKSYVRFDSKSVSVIFGYNERERSNFVFVGVRGQDPHELDKKNLKDVFGYDTETHLLDRFLSDFLSDKGNGILVGDLAILRKLDEYQKERSSVYTDNLIKRQHLNIADKAWDKKDYLTFVRHIDLIGKENLPKSYTLKYKMASGKIQPSR